MVFDIDANGIMHVSAKEKSTGKEQKVTIQGATGLSDDEIVKAKENAEKFADDDKKKREIIESKNRLEAVIYQLENMKTDNVDKLPDEEKEKIDLLLTEARALKDKEDITKEELDTEIEKYSKEVQDMMGKYAATDTTSKTDSDDIIEDDGDVIDAEGGK